MELINSLVLTFCSVIVTKSAFIIMSLIKRKTLTINTDYYLKRYEFYKKIYIAYCIRDISNQKISLELNDFFDNLCTSLSNDLIYISPKIRRKLIKNKQYIKKSENNNNLTKLRYELCISSIMNEIQKEYNNCCSVLGYKTYKKYYIIANASLFIFFVIISLIYSVPNLKNIISHSSYTLISLSVIILLIITSVTFILTKDYFVRY